MPKKVPYNPADRAADLAMIRMQNRIKRIYSEAEKDISKKLSDFTEKFKAKDAKYRQDVKDGKITQDDYDAWRQGQIFQGKRWKAMRQEMTDQITRANVTATGIINGERRVVFQQNANYTAYQLEKATHGAVNFGLYDSATVTRLLEKNKKLLPEWKIDEPKDYKWNNRRVNNAITQGIIQGEPLDKIEKRLTESLEAGNRSTMLTFARTAMTGAQNAGRIEAMHDAEDMGVKVQKRWIATLDSRTRDTHAELDGQVVDVDEPFEVDGMKIMYPGDPNADPSLVYNCRCTLGYEYPDYAGNGQRRDNETGEVIEYQTYKEWEKEKIKTLEVASEKELTRNNIATLSMLSQAQEWANDAFKDEMQYQKEAWANVPKQIKALEQFEKEIPQYIESVSNAIEKNDFATKTDSEAVIKILGDGRFKSQIETGQTHGYKDIDKRKRLADQIFAFGEQIEAKENEYEIYGYLDNASRANIYGNCRIVLKKENLMDRTTITIGDSLELNEYGADPVASNAKSPQIFSYGIRQFSNSVPNAESRLADIRRDFKEIEKTGHLASGNYLELQFHGGVTIDDIEYIQLPKGDIRAKEVKELAEEKGIKIKWIH